MKKFGIVGKDISYSQSKKLFDDEFKGKYSYDIIDTDKISKELLLKYDGLNVTTPYKTEVIKYLDTVDSKAEKRQSVNCILNNNGKLEGYNTDYYGFQKSLEGHKIKSMLVLGNGGVLGTIKDYAKTYGINIVVCGRRGIYDINYKDLWKYDYDCIVNATKFGVLPPIEYGWIKENTLVFDLCYGETTRFIEECKKFGHEYCMDGEMMLKYQAQLSWYIWDIKE